MLTDEDMAYMLQRVHERLQLVNKTANSREDLFGRKKEEHLMNVIRQVVAEYRKFSHMIEEVVRKIRSCFPS